MRASIGAIMHVTYTPIVPQIVKVIAMLELSWS